MEACRSPTARARETPGKLSHGGSENVVPASRRGREGRSRQAARRRSEGPSRIRHLRQQRGTGAGCGVGVGGGNQARATAAVEGRVEPESLEPQRAGTSGAREHGATCGRRARRPRALGHDRATNDPAPRSRLPRPRAFGVDTCAAGHPGCTARGVRDQGDPGPATGAAARKVAGFRKARTYARLRGS